MNPENPEMRIKLFVNKPGCVVDRQDHQHHNCNRMNDRWGSYTANFNFFCSSKWYCIISFFEKLGFRLFWIVSVLHISFQSSSVGLNSNTTTTNWLLNVVLIYQDQIWIEHQCHSNSLKDEIYKKSNLHEIDISTSVSKESSIIVHEVYSSRSLTLHYIL